ncbi:alpha/beta fold hydrolase [Krasilnikovia sp. M28-CT-15]|uniref:alpha/beta fold hydrolase n=1 Tax=Krasilnikovia sp. M28-CT-15 TaxID=3373540 RepID=UPI00399D3941
MGAGVVERIVTLAGERRLPVREGGDLGGLPVLFHHGTPASRHAAALVDAAAHRAGIRLISFNRPGYGDVPTNPPSLASVGADTIRIADAIGIERFATAGISGGGPYALATALAGPERVVQVTVVAGIGPWRIINPDDPNDPERQFLSLADAGQIEEALAGFRAELAAETGDLLSLDDEAMMATYLDGAPPDDLRWLDRHKRLLWAVDLREALHNMDGYARDNVAWGGEWDIDISALGCPVRLYYGDQDRLVPPEHGRWLAERIPHALLVTFPEAGHGTTAFDFWDTILAALHDTRTVRSPFR